MNITSNYGLKKPSLTDSASITVLSDNFQIIDETMKEIDDSSIFETAGGSGAVITLTNVKLINGYPKTFIAIANNNGSATTINGKNLYKPSSTTAPTLIAGKAYEVWYNSSGNCFFLKASSEGDALVSHVLAGKKFSNDDDTGLIGTMPNNGNLSASLNCGASYTIPLGYTSGGTITANSLASQTSATSSVAQILSGYTAWVNGSKITGNIPSKGSQTYTPTTYNQTISAGQYLSGNQVILGDSDLIASNIVSTANIFGIQGTATVESLGGTKYATGYISYFTSTSYTITLPFTPKRFGCNFAKGGSYGGVCTAQTSDVLGYTYNNFSLSWGASSYGDVNISGNNINFTDISTYVENLHWFAIG